MKESELKSKGFYKHTNVFTGKDVWAWGSYTRTTPEVRGVEYVPIIEWDEKTQQAYASPINYLKTITTMRGMEKFIDATNFLMSTET